MKFSFYFINNTGTYSRKIFSLVQAFYNNSPHLRKINHACICLIPKVKEANTIQIFRPICLINYSFKIIDSLISNSQTVYINYSFKIISFVLKKYLFKSIKISQKAYYSNSILEKSLTWLTEIFS